MLWENGSRLPAFMNEPCSWHSASCVHMLWKWGIKWKLRGNRRFFILLFCGRFDFGFCKKTIKKKTTTQNRIILKSGFDYLEKSYTRKQRVSYQLCRRYLLWFETKNWNAFKEMLFKNILCTIHSMCTNTGT